MSRNPSALDLLGQWCDEHNFDALTFSRLSAPPNLAGKWAVTVETGQWFVDDDGERYLGEGDTIEAAAQKALQRLEAMS